MKNYKIPFNKAYLAGNEIKYITEVVNTGKISGNGMFTKKCQEFFEKRYGFKKALMTTSCTDALEMCAILADIKPDDEVIVPSYTFVSSALAFVRQGANIKFVDSRKDHPGLDESKVEKLITSKTKVIVVVHYAGVACDMNTIMALAKKYDLIVIEDAAQAIESYYNDQPLGSIGHMAAFSFHETKNIISGEGGLLAINDKRFVPRAEIIWEKGTNRAEFFRGEINKYGWVDTGSSFLPSEIISAYLWAQIENIQNIQNRRIEIWNKYYIGLKDWAHDNDITLPNIPQYATNNGHMFYLMCKDERQRGKIIKRLEEKNIHAVFHYQSLHRSEYYVKITTENNSLIMADKYTSNLVRLPMFFELSDNSIDNIIGSLKDIL